MNTPYEQLNLALLTDEDKQLLIDTVKQARESGLTFAQGQIFLRLLNKTAKDKFCGICPGVHQLLYNYAKRFVDENKH